MNKFTDVDSFLAFIEKQKRITNKVNLDDMRAFAKIIGNPEKTFKSIHVTGTNGKGSVVCYLSQMYQAVGLNVGTFTSPYIEKFNERIQYNTKFIDDDTLLRLCNFIITKYPEFFMATNTYPSFFEFITLLAFLFFKEKKVDIAIIEVGIGGLLDSTNIITPIASVISNVAYDHMNILGNTIDAILKQKLGIVKPGVPLIAGLKDSELIKIAKNEVNEKKSTIYLPLIKALEIKKCDVSGSHFIVEGFDSFTIQMKGYHQIENAIVAYQTFMVTKDLLNLENCDIKVIKNALAHTFWLGRFEVIKEKPLIVIDGGHNVDAIERITTFVNQLPYQKKRCIFACSDNKEKEKMLNLLKESFDEIIITEFSYLRHTDANALFNGFAYENKLLIPNIKDAIKYVNDHPFDFNLFIGSLYFVSEIRPLLLNT